MGRLRPESNNDLGLLRSLAVKKAWKEFVQQQSQSEELAKVTIRSYSAGQTIPIGESKKMILNFTVVPTVILVALKYA